MADRVTLHSLPVFVRLGGRPVMLIGAGDAADAKRRLLERAGAVIVGEDSAAALAIVALDDPDATVARLSARGILVNAVDRPDLCDFTLPAIVDRSPVIVAVGTGGASAGLAGALRQRLETILPAGLSDLAKTLFATRNLIREEFPDPAARRQALAKAFSPGGDLDPLGPDPDVYFWLAADELHERPTGLVLNVTLASADPDDLTLRQARALAQADLILHAADVPTAVLDRARADAPRVVSLAPPVDKPEGQITQRPDVAAGLTVYLEMAR
jgi:uroporphyrin-III C-methyltransferase/precorrin-2 dehydrogenase/sirohydrochlorin ferrochelatase